MSLQFAAMSVTARLAVLGCTLAALLGIGAFGGCTVQRKLDDGKIARAEAKTEAMRGNLKEAGKALDAAATTFHQISAKTKQNKAEADRRMAEAKHLAEQAGKDADKFRRRVAALQAEADRENETCPEARMLVCGSPLR